MHITWEPVETIELHGYEWVVNGLYDVGRMFDSRICYLYIVDAQHGWWINSYDEVSDIIDEGLEPWDLTEPSRISPSIITKQELIRVVPKDQLNTLSDMFN